MVAHPGVLPEQMYQPINLVHRYKQPTTNLQFPCDFDTPFSVKTVCLVMCFFNEFWSKSKTILEDFLYWVLQKLTEKHSENPFYLFCIQTQGKLPAIVHLAAILKGKEVRALPREAALSLLGIHEGFRLQTFCCFLPGALLMSCMLLLPPWILCSSDASAAILNPAFPII